MPLIATCAMSRLLFHFLAAHAGGVTRTGSVLSINQGKLIQVRASGLGDLLKIVMEQFQLHCYLSKRAKEGVEDEDVLFDVKSITIIAQTFTALVVEAFYFDYYYEKHSKSKAEKWSKQSPIKQFEIISVEIFHDADIINSSLYASLKDLNRMRKRWVHNQSTQLGKYRKDLNFISADGCVQLLRELFDYFYHKDSSYLLSKHLFDILSDLQCNAKGYNGL